MKDDLTPFVVGAIAAHVLIPDEYKPMIAWVSGLGIVAVCVYGAVKDGFRKN